MKVLKFGGTSVGSAQRMKEVGPSLSPNFMLMLVLIKCVYQLHDSFCIRVLLTAIYKFPFYHNLFWKRRNLPLQKVDVLY